MRVYLNNDKEAEEFSDFLLEIGNGTYPITEKPFMIKLPQEFVNLKNNR